MEKQLFEKVTEFLTDTNRLYEEYIDDAGNLIKSTESLSHLTSAMRSGLEVYNLVLASEDYKEDADIQGVLCEIAKQIEKVKATEANAKKLDFVNSFVIWESIVGNALALCMLLLAGVEVRQDEE